MISPSPYSSPIKGEDTSFKRDLLRSPLFFTIATSSLSFATPSLSFASFLSSQAFCHRKLFVILSEAKNLFVLSSLRFFSHPDEISAPSGMTGGVMGLLRHPDYIGILHNHFRPATASLSASTTILSSSGSTDLGSKNSTSPLTRPIMGG